MAKRTFLYTLILVLFVVGILPVLSMFFKSVFLDGHFTFKLYAEIFKSPNHLNLFKNSFLLSITVTLFTVFVGVFLGVLLFKTDIPMKEVFLFLFFIPLLIPPYILSLSWTYLLGRGGVLDFFLTPATILKINHFLFGFWGSFLVLSTIFLPIPIFLTLLFLKRINPEFEEMGRLFTNWKGVLKGITIPLIKPAIFVSSVLVFLLTFGELSVPLFFRYNVFTVESFTQFSAFYNFNLASAFSFVLAFFTLFLVFIVEILWGREFYGIIWEVKEERELLIELGKYRWLAFFSLFFILFFVVFLPLLILFLKSGGVDNYITAIEIGGESILRSLLYAFLSGTVLSIFGFFIGYLISRRSIKLWKLVDLTTIFLFALPGTVVGIGLIILWNSKLTSFVYNSFLIIIMGYLAKYVVLTGKIFGNYFMEIPSSIEESAQIVGAGWFKRVFYILLPLMKRAVLTSWVVGYIFSLRDVDITMIVYPPGGDTITVKIFTTMANGSPGVISAMCVITIFLTLALPFFIFYLFTYGNFFRRGSFLVWK